jgi:hypothetical protein
MGIRNLNLLFDDGPSPDIALEERRKLNIGGQVDNARLPAGAVMYYYCHCCGAKTAMLPEDWVENPPSRYCPDCEKLPESERTSYDEWLRERGHPPVPR